MTKIYFYGINHPGNSIMDRLKHYRKCLIWIQENNTDIEVDQELEEMGISKKEIVVGFHHPSMREYSDYAVSSAHCRITDDSIA
jgi:hypothetical protein